MRKLLIALAGSSLIFALSCSKSNEDGMTPTDPNDPGGGSCDTSNRRYAAHVVPILQANCYGCHGASSTTSGILLEGYENIKPRADNGRLIGVITHAQGFPAMPKDRAKLSDCNINIIRSWINNGAQDN